MNKKGLGVFLIILGIFGGIYLYVLVGFFGSIGFGGGLIYAGYKLCTAKNFELVSEKIILNKSNNGFNLEICVKNLSNKEGQIFVNANIYKKEQLIFTVTTNTLTVLPNEIGRLNADININPEEVNINEITHKIIGYTIR